MPTPSPQDGRLQTGPLGTSAREVEKGAAEVGLGAPQGRAREQAGLRAGWVQRTRSVPPSGTHTDLSPQSKLERKDKTPVTLLKECELVTHCNTRN